jgi:hypothetical protein
VRNPPVSTFFVHEMWLLGNRITITLPPSLRDVNAALSRVKFFKVVLEYRVNGLFVSDLQLLELFLAKLVPPINFLHLLL